MEAIVDQALGDVAGLYAVLCLQPIAEDHFVHRSGFVRQLVNSFELLANVVRVEHRVLGGLAQPIWTIGEDVGQRAYEHAEVAVEGADASDRMRTAVLKSKLAIRPRSQHRSGQKWLQD